MVWKLHRAKYPLYRVQGKEGKKLIYETFWTKKQAKRGLSMFKSRYGSDMKNIKLYKMGFETFKQWEPNWKRYL